MAEDRENEEKALGELPGVSYDPRIPVRKWVQPAQPPKKAPIGTIPEKTFVRSTFDTRPINEIDFISTPPSQDLSGGEGVLTMSFPYQVPPNRVAIVRGFRYEVTPEVSNALLSYYSLSFTLDGIYVQGYTNLNLGQTLPAYRPCHIIVNQESVITAILTLNVTLWTLAPSVTLTGNFEFYGNLLLSRGLPANFEPGEIMPSEAKIYKESE